jgi:hypothetical protein
MPVDWKERVNILEFKKYLIPFYSYFVQVSGDVRVDITNDGK